MFVLKRFVLVLILIFAAASTLPAQAEPVRFAGKGKNVVHDKQTGLDWQKADSYMELKRGMNWYQALEYLNKKNREKFGGFGDWRLPTMEELKGLWDSNLPLRSKDDEPVGLPSIFAGGGSYYLWSADERNLDNAWYFGLGQQENYFNLKELGDLEQGVKMVRGPNKGGKAKTP